MSKTKALVLMSGGLDSMLAARTLMEQGVEVTGLVFVSNFFGAAKARKAAEQLGVELKEVEFKKAHLDMVKNPKHGYGKNMNPCIDCHAMMLKYAKKIMEGKSPQLLNPPTPLIRGAIYDFVATGEVLGQRPMSQNSEALKIVERESGLGDLLVRPMSAKLLDESRPEKEGLLIRRKLHAISGRSREEQKELVKKYKIKEYASPGGGCLLTDPEFSQRLIKLFEYWPECEGDDIELLKNGRVFWVNGKNGKVLIIVGRDKEESENLEKLAKNGDVVVELKDEVGPVTIVRMQNADFRILNNELEIEVPDILKLSELKLGEEKSDEEILGIAALLTGYHAPKARGGKSIIQSRVPWITN
jgi:tRNA U34 2-thiouridine synthase MnmA/TrmU